MSWTQRIGGTMTALAAVAVAASACGSAPAAPTPPTAAAGPHVLTASAASCVGHWPAGPAGPRTFTVSNDGRQPLQVTFIDADTGATYGQIRLLDPGTARPLAVDAPAGSYRFRCVPRRGVAAVSASAHLTGAGGSSASAVTPLSAEEVHAAVATYRRAVRRGVTRLVTATTALDHAVRQQRRRVAERTWLTAHLDFARLGAAYGTFGALSVAIDGRADGLPGGVHDPSFTGFLAVEHALWHASSQLTLRTVTDRLTRDVRRLGRELPHLRLIAGDLPLRSHEILENALQFELTGATDEGSHTNLATVLANVAGTRLVVRALTPALRSRQPDLLVQIDAGLRAVSTELRELRSRSGRWPAVDALPTMQRERLDGAVDGMLEKLSLLPGVLTLPASLALP